MVKIVKQAVPASKKAKRAAANAARVCIFSPSHRATFSLAYASSLFHVTNQGPANNVGFTFGAVSNADIVWSRNYMLSRFYFNVPNATHILMLDDDMGFPPELIFEMLALKEDVVGTLYPRRSIDLQALHTYARLPFSEAKLKAMSYIGEAHPSGEKKGKFLRANKVGTGIFLVSRKAVDLMRETFPDHTRHPDHEAAQIPSDLPELLTFFDKVTVDGKELSEDFSFCHRWTEGCGQKLWAAGHHEISHVGEFNYSGKLT